MDKLLLLLVNAPAHPLQSRDGKVTTMFLPPNTTSITDQRILKALKRWYKKCLLRPLIVEIDPSGGEADFGAYYYYFNN